MTSGDIEARQLIQEACDLVDRVEPRLCALVAEPERRRRLLAEAERQDSTLRPFLVGVKDIVNVAGLPTRAGSTLPGELFAGLAATVVVRLRAAGAIVLGKTTTTEFAFTEPPPPPLIHTTSAIHRVAPAAAQLRRWRPGMCRWRSARRQSTRS